jgi:hypothetical protein
MTLLVSLGDCLPGLFIFEGSCLGFKSEYKTESESYPGFWQSDAYVVESGEYFWGGTSDARKREKLLVLPINVEDT